MLVMPVYKPIVPYLDRLGVKRVKICYNVLNGPCCGRRPIMPTYTIPCGS